MRKIIGIGETILDIIFRGNRPEKAVPGGSTFNCMVSLGHCHVPALFISELGKDRVGKFIKDFMLENHLSPDYIAFFEDGSSPVALAFLNEQQNAEYQFYTEFPEKRLQIEFPEIAADDMLVFGSYFAVNPKLRKTLSDLLSYAKSRGALIYYDINFRKAHAAEKIQLMPYFFENFESADIVRCSDEDLAILFPGESIASIYRQQIAPRCRNFIVTKGEKGILLKTAAFEKTYPVEALTPVSTIGAGDSFNAGLIYGLMQQNIQRGEVETLPEKEWDKLINTGKKFAEAVCMSMDNYVPEGFIQNSRQ
ncbi:MAG: carbohydrate kinase [Dysgonamonadaceae bacterium]|jgi:fructokinase|nr:carbohydrate kinase [Dysgonamonadaceae bacterium]